MAVQAGVMRTMSCAHIHPLLAALTLGWLTFTACTPRDVDVGEHIGKGEACDPGPEIEAPPQGPRCAESLACEPLAGADSFVCAAPLRIHGTVVDALTLAPLPGAHVHGFDRTGAPSGAPAVSDAAGHYELVVSAPRRADGELAQDADYTLQGFARDHQPFPSGIRVALPISADEAVYEDALAAFVVDNPSTIVGLTPLPMDERGSVTISGHVLGDQPGGALVVVEGHQPAPYAVADADGAYTVFNVRSGPSTVHGYRRGLEIVPRDIDVKADTNDIDLEVAAEGEGLAQVTGSVTIVNGQGSSMTSVVLVPVSVFNDGLLRGPVPLGLRTPDPGVAPDVTGSFTLTGVPAGTYKVLAAFENDGLVRDPDLTIGGTSLQEITIAAGSDTALEESFKVTGALAVISPGAQDPEVVDARPTFVFADDSSEDYYIVRVFDVLGALVWEAPMVPRVSGSKTVEVDYAGPPLAPGGYYQFRATSARDKGGGTAISQTEDLRGVFIVAGPPKP